MVVGVNVQRAKDSGRQGSTCKGQQDNGDKGQRAKDSKTMVVDKGQRSEGKRTMVAGVNVQRGEELWWQVGVNVQAAWVIVLVRPHRARRDERRLCTLVMTGVGFGEGLRNVAKNFAGDRATCSTSSTLGKKNIYFKYRLRSFLNLNSEILSFK